MHPDSSPAVRSGVCILESQVDALADPCRDFLVSGRRYSVSSSAASELELIERRRTLRTTPLDGCTSASQCETLAAKEPLLTLDDHPIEAELPEPAREFSWVCEADPSRLAGVDRCIMSCESTEDCEAGFSCSAQRCVEAPLPPAECLDTVQRYRIQAGEAFAVVGTDDGLLHSVVADPDTGQCVRRDDAHPLNVGRIPLRPAPCDDDGDILTGPNPCSTTVSHSENYTPFTIDGNRCVPQEVKVRTREVPAVRFSNPSMTFHFVDTETSGDLQCRNDRAAADPVYSTVFAGYQILLEIGGGFLPKVVPNLEAALPIRIVPDPTGKLWILDQGDASSITRGRLFRIDPKLPGGFELTPIL